MLQFISLFTQKHKITGTWGSSINIYKLHWFTGGGHKKEKQNTTKTTIKEEKQIQNTTKNKS